MRLPGRVLITSPYTKLGHQDNISDSQLRTQIVPEAPAGWGLAQSARLADVPQLKLNSFQNSGFSTIGNSIN